MLALPGTAERTAEKEVRPARDSHHRHGHVGDLASAFAAAADFACKQVCNSLTWRGISHCATTRGLRGKPMPDIFISYRRSDSVHIRSEERRVGKECRSRWS